MAVKLHRCSMMWLKLPGHPCWRVQKALDDAGVEYELVKGPLSRKKRARVAELTGQDKYPVIEREDGTGYRDDSQQMAEKIRSGQLSSA